MKGAVWFAFSKKNKKYASMISRGEEGISSEDIYDMTNIFTVAIDSEDSDDKEKQMMTQIRHQQKSLSSRKGFANQSKASSFRDNIPKHFIETHDTGTVSTLDVSSHEESYNDDFVANDPLKTFPNSAFVEWNDKKGKHSFQRSESFAMNDSCNNASGSDETFPEDAFSDLPFKSIPRNFLQDLASSLEQPSAFETIVDDTWPSQQKDKEDEDDAMFRMGEIKFHDDDIDCSNHDNEAGGLKQLCDTLNAAQQDGIATSSDEDDKVEHISGEKEKDLSSWSSERERHVINEVALDFFSGKMKGTYSGDSIMTPEGPIPHGRGKVTFTNGDFYKGNFQNGQLHGKRATYTCSKDDTKYNGEYKNNLKHGIGKQKFANGKLYVGQYQRGVPHGHGVELDGVGKVIHCGQWKEGVPVLML
eukprot:CAMPEP_0178910048 /NCGR_PEP_ID=MMETSP0786-20121207/8880_1 /TAXON_ID=186022 /ORGANISM="Thalassionema frauenfeldii, Strain CCMP 1798" /LENGTH=416 /DNA_ID=CAMNT_0020582255 /DNA_START=39 /DNA_END=1289 /DNA_ORIENTATION=+